MSLAISLVFSGNQARNWIKNNMMKLADGGFFSIFFAHYIGGGTL